MKKLPDSGSNQLRQKVEKLLKNKPPQKTPVLSEADTLRLIHELEVHQVELEMQNEELQKALGSAKDSLELYDFAPSGYFTLSGNGEIKRLNITGSAMLGQERTLVINSRFDTYITPESKPVFARFMDNVFRGISKQTCEITLSSGSHNPVYVSLTGIVSNNENQCLITAIDITEFTGIGALNDVLLASLPYPAMYIRKNEMVVLSANKSATDLGVKPGGQCWREFMLAMHISDENKKVAANFPDIVPAHYNIRCTFCKADECFVSTLSQNNPELNSIGAVWDTYWIKVSNDVFLHYAINISERLQAEDTRRRNEDHYRTLVSNIPSVAFVLNEDGIFTLSEGKGLAKLNLQPGEVVGLSAFDFYHDNPSIIDLIRNAYQGNSRRREISLQGNVFDVVTTPVFDKLGKVSEVIGVANDITDFKLFEEKIRIAHSRLRRFIDSDIVGIIIADPEGNVIETNEYYLNLIGYSREEFESGQVNWRDITPSEWLYTDDKAINELRKTGKCTPYEKEYIRKDGSHVVVLITDALLPGPEEQIVGFVLDITERKQAEKALQESELKYRELIENSPDAIVIYSKGEVILANKESLRLMAVNSAEVLVGKPVLNFVHPDYRELVYSRMKKMAEDSVVLPLSEEIFIRPDGSELVVEVKAMPIRFENKKAVQLIIRDITNRKQAEEELKNSELKFRELFEVNSDGITIFNISPAGPSIILDMNENAAKMVGYSKDEMKLFSPNDIEKDVTQAKMEERMHDLISKGFSNFETIIKHKDGHEIDVEIKVMMVNYNNQPALMNIVRDITDRKNSEIQLQKYAIELGKQIAEKDKFFSIIAHDLRGPFNGFLELTELMASGSSGMSMEDIQKIAGIMKKSATNLFRLLGNLLEWSRMQRGITTYDPMPIILSSKIYEITSLAEEAASKKGIAIYYNIPKDLVVFADENMLEGILRNLVTNAVKYSNAGGIVTVSAKYVPGDTVEFSIKDTGIGMSSTTVDNLFTLDVNTSRKGTAGELSTGLGLMICKDFIEKHHGILRIESVVGIGSTFFFTIPGRIQSAPNKISSYPVTDTTSDPVRKLNILIAEDEETSDLLISIALSKISRECYHAKTGLEAITICRVHPDIDLIIMDIKMPEMDGYEATRQIRLFNKNVIIIAQTAFAFTNDREKSLEAGCNDYIAKPISQTELMEIIRKHVKE